MRGTVAKRLRRKVYGDDLAPRARRYEWRKVEGRGSRGATTGFSVSFAAILEFPRTHLMVVADNLRRWYQAEKRAYR